MCFEINGLKYFKLTILRFFPRSPLNYTTLIAVKAFFIVKTSFIIHKFTWIHLNSHNFYTYILKCIFLGSNYFGVYGSWLVWLLLYVFMVADLLESLIQSRTESKKKFFLSKFSSQVNLFAILIIHILPPLKDFDPCFVWQMRNEKWQSETYS